MFPVPKTKLIEVTYSNIDKFLNFKNEQVKNKYIFLVKEEMKEITSKNIGQKAMDLYTYRYQLPESFVSKRCFDFKNIEKEALQYIKPKTIAAKLEAAKNNQMRTNKDIKTKDHER